MPVAYITNKVATRDYGYFDRDGMSKATITFGDGLDLETICSVLSVSEHSDVLILDGSPLISAVCLAVWLERHEHCMVYSLSGNMWLTNLIARSSMRRVMEKAYDEVARAR